MIRNIRYAVRLLAKSPAFTVTAVLCLGLGIGANTALFSIFNTLLWKPLPVAGAADLVRVFSKGPTKGLLYQDFSYAEYVNYAAESRVFAGLVASRGVQAVLRTNGSETGRIFGEAVSDNYFEVLRLHPRAGRLLLAPPGGAHNLAAEVVLSHRLWQRRFASAPDIVGRTVWLSGAPFTVVGVAPDGFKGTYSSPVFASELWVPLGTLALIEPGGGGVFEDRRDRSLSLLGRLASGMRLQQAQKGVDTIAARLAASYPETNKGVRTLLFRELDTHPEVYSSRAVNLIAFLFLGLAGLVLLVACANLANLMLARAAARRKEMAVRLALGASRARLVQQLLAEAVVLSLAAGVVGVLVASAAAHAVSSVRLPVDLPIIFDVAIDARTLWFTLATALASSAAFGLLPALNASRPDLVPALKGGSPAASGRWRVVTLSNTLVIAQVAVSLVLLIAAGLFWRSISGVQAIRPGMELQARSVVSFSPSLLHYDAARTATFYRVLLERVRQSPAIEDAALASWIPLGFACQEAQYGVRGATGSAEPGADEATSLELATLVNQVSPRYFDTAGVPIRKGRGFTELDTSTSQPVAIVNETFARRAWPGSSALGRQVRSNRAGAPWLTVVGVVADGKYRTLTEPPRPCLLRPLSQQPSEALTLVVKARGHSGAVAAIRRETLALDPDMTLLDVKTMDQQMAKVRFLPQATTALAGPAAAIAVLIAAIGLYGVVACSVGRRTREFGIRLAVGARARDIVTHVMSDALALVGVGVALGLGAALAVARLARGLLVGVTPTDAGAFLPAIALLLGVAAAAVYLPARRASRVDPLTALRQD